MIAKLEWTQSIAQLIIEQIHKYVLVPADKAANNVVVA